MSKSNRYDMCAHIHTKKSPWDISHSLTIDFEPIKTNDDYLSDVVNTKAGEVFHKDLSIKGWLQESYSQVLGANELEYAEVYKANQFDLERMLKTLKNLNKKLQTISEKYGYPQGFHTYIQRVFQVLGVTKVVFNKDTIVLAGTDPNNTTVDPIAAIYILQNLERNVCKKVA